MIELAIVAPVLVLFIIGMSDLALAGALKYSLTKAAGRAAEAAISNGARNGKLDYVRTEAAAAAAVPEKNVELDYWLECDYVRMDDFSGECVPPELPFRYVRVVISSDYKPLFPEWAVPAVIPVEGASVVRIQ